MEEVGSAGEEEGGGGGEEGLREPDGEANEVEVFAAEDPVGGSEDHEEGRECEEPCDEGATFEEGARHDVEGDEGLGEGPADGEGADDQHGDEGEDDGDRAWSDGGQALVAKPHEGHDEPCGDGQERVPVFGVDEDGATSDVEEDGGGIGLESRPIGVVPLADGFQE